MVEIWREVASLSQISDVESQRICQEFSETDQICPRTGCVPIDGNAQDYPEFVQNVCHALSSDLRSFLLEEAEAETDAPSEPAIDPNQFLAPVAPSKAHYCSICCSENMIDRVTLSCQPADTVQKCVFCRECIAAWLSINLTCPNCRRGNLRISAPAPN